MIEFSQFIFPFQFQLPHASLFKPLQRKSIGAGGWRYEGRKDVACAHDVRQHMRFARPPSASLPDRLPCIEVYTPSFEQGLDEKLVEAGLANHLMCPICRCLLRRPASLYASGRCIYERCI